jgi:hypothetical protein
MSKGLDGWDDPPRPSISLAMIGRLADLRYVCGLQSLGSLDDIELHLLTLGEGLEPLGLDRGEVNEDVLAPLLLDEAKPLRIVEPLHTSLCHFELLLMHSAGDGRFRPSVGRETAGDTGIPPARCQVRPDTAR